MSSSMVDTNALLDEINTEQTPLQKQVAFFDRNKDGLIYPWETFQGMRAIGCNLILSFGASILINVFFSGSTRPGKFPSLLFPIEIATIHLAKHGSDSGAYDTEGRFDPEKFEEIFTKHAKTNPNSLTFRELRAMLKANREPADFRGWFLSFAEWVILFYLCKNQEGVLEKETAKGVYDGSVFEQLAEKHTSTRT